MVGQIFELSKLESANFELHREPFVFSEVLQEVLRGKGPIECVNGTDGAWVDADISMMERVLQNLVVNAVAYTREGGKIVVALERNAGELVCRVRNEGIALTPELVSWFKGAEAARPNKPAIGLSIVKRALAMHGFVFGVGEEGGWNEFCFRMPVVG